MARRIAEAIHKLHQANLPTERVHTMADELRILRECFDKVVAQRPEWTGRLARLMVACGKLGARVPLPKACGIHRDFYSSQVIVERGLQPASTRAGGNGSGVNAALPGRLWLIDFDLYCQGDPALDVGNFIGMKDKGVLSTPAEAAASVLAFLARHDFGSKPVADVRD